MTIDLGFAWGGAAQRTRGQHRGRAGSRAFHQEYARGRRRPRSRAARRRGGRIGDAANPGAPRHPRSAGCAARRPPSSRKPTSRTRICSRSRSWKSRRRWRARRFAGSPMLAVSAVTGAGLPELLAAMDAALDETEQRRDVGRPAPFHRTARFRLRGSERWSPARCWTARCESGKRWRSCPADARRGFAGCKTHRPEGGDRRAGQPRGGQPERRERGRKSRGGKSWRRPAGCAPLPQSDVRLTALADAPHGVRHNLPVTFHAFRGGIAREGRVYSTRTRIAPGEEGWAQIALGAAPSRSRAATVSCWRSADATLGGGDGRRRRREASPQAARPRA